MNPWVKYNVFFLPVEAIAKKLWINIQKTLMVTDRDNYEPMDKGKCFLITS